MTKTLHKLNLEDKYGPSHFKSAFGINVGHQEVVNLKIRKYCERIFSATLLDYWGSLVRCETDFAQFLVNFAQNNAKQGKKKGQLNFDKI